MIGWKGTMVEEVIIEERDLKKILENTCGDLIDDCLALSSERKKRFNKKEDGQ